MADDGAPFDPNRPDLLLGVVGAGAMGRGIAQVAATGGIAVLMTDARPGAAEEARGFVSKMIERAAEKGAMTRDAAAAAVARIGIVDGLAGLAPCHVVVEAVTENLDLKRRIFAELDGIVADDCILATNTSSLSVTSIAAGARLPGRIAGLHFFNPVPLMKLVEVVDAVLTETWVGDALMTVGRRLGREPIRLADAPGFLVNQIGRGFTMEAAQLLSERIADTATVDRILRETAGFRMGPFELMDLTGLDVSHPASEAIYRQCYEEPRYRPSTILRARLEAGVLGRKTGRGFYAYANGKPEVPPEPPAPAARPARVWVSKAEPEGHAAVVALLRALGAASDEGERPGADSLCIVTPLGEDATTAALDQGLDPRRAVAIDTLFGLDRRRVLMTTPVTKPAMRDAAHGLLASDGCAVSVIRDSAGFVAQRIVAMIVSIGCSVAQQGTAAPADIDRAVMLGLSYPHGPLGFGDALGPGRILRVLTGMQRCTGDPRYRPSPWLTRRARLGVALTTPDAAEA